MEKTITIHKDINGCIADTVVRFPTNMDAKLFAVFLVGTIGCRMDEKNTLVDNNYVSVHSFIVDSNVVDTFVKAYLYDNPKLEYKIEYIE